MSKERLEEIKSKAIKQKVHVKQLGTRKGSYWTQSYEILKEDWDYLIEQAERVKELEDIISQDKRQEVLEGLYESEQELKKRVQELEQENKIMFDTLNKLSSRETYSMIDGQMKGQAIDSIKQILRLRRNRHD